MWLHWARVGEKVDCKGHEKTFGGERNVHYLDHGDNFTGVYMSSLLYIKGRRREEGKGGGGGRGGKLLI